MMRKIAILLSCAAFIYGCTQKTEAERVAGDLLSRMTLREKLGQMSQFAPSTGVVTGP